MTPADQQRRKDADLRTRAARSIGQHHRHNQSRFSAWIVTKRRAFILVEGAPYWESSGLPPIRNPRS